MVETTVDLDALDNHEFIIKPEFDDSLRTIRKKLDRLKYDMESEHQRVGQDLNQEIDKKLFLENHRVHGWCFRLTRNVSLSFPYCEHALTPSGIWMHSKQKGISGMLDAKERCFLHNICSSRITKRIRSAF